MKTIRKIRNRIRAKVMWNRLDDKTKQWIKYLFEMHRYNVSLHILISNIAHDPTLEEKKIGTYDIYCFFKAGYLFEAQ